MSLKETINNRLIRLRAAMAERGLDGLIVLGQENRHWLSGYTAADPQFNESAGLLLITTRRAALFTDGRYGIWAAREARGYEVIIHQAGAAEGLAPVIASEEAVRLGFEEERLSVAAFEGLRKALKGTELIPASGLVEGLREIKDQLEMRRIVKALRITEQALGRIMAWMKPGLTELETARRLEEIMVELGAEGPAFESIVASGPNAAEPHAAPGPRRFGPGDPVVVDCGARYKGYCSDITRTIIMGQPEPWLAKIYRTVREAQILAIKEIGPGVSSRAVDQAARAHIEAAGYGPYFNHSLGHGVGLATHEAPTLSRLKDTSLKPGMVVTVEPGIYIKGRGGVRLEQMVKVTQRGARVLNKDQTFYSF